VCVMATEGGTRVPIVRALAGVLAYRMLATVAPAIVGAGILANFHIGALRRRIVRSRARGG